MSSPNFMLPLFCELSCQYISFVINTSDQILYLLVYVDNIILTGDNGAIIKQFMDLLAQRFSRKDLGTLSYFLGVEFVPHKQDLLLSQWCYITNLLTHTSMTTSKSVVSPLATSLTLTLYSGFAVTNPTKYHIIVSIL